MTHFACSMKLRVLLVTVLLALVIGTPQVGFGRGAPIQLGASQEVDEFLRRFRSDPARAMEEAPPRWDEFGRRLNAEAPEERIFTPEAVEQGRALEGRDRFRARMCMSRADGSSRCLADRPGSRAGIEGSDRPEDLIDEKARNSAGKPLFSTLEQMEYQGLRGASLGIQPWSGDYWATYKGGVGARFGDPYFPSQSMDWRVLNRYVRTRPVREIQRVGSDEQVNNLSPSEKYELLIGSSSFFLTDAQWQIGEREYSEKGQVESWMGICHGWSAAALMTPRPPQAVSVPSADGRRLLRFYPADLKALTSLLWAESDFDHRFIGGRCRSRTPRQDGNGRIVDPECFDSNPATWHLAVTHQIGVARRGFVLDASMDYQIWNQPALAYGYSYFNPQTGRAAATLREARVPIRYFTQDPFRRYRSLNVSEVVGIVMDFTYVRGTNANQETRDSASRDRLRTVRYFYDLELDSAGRIIGGEWYTHAHPDFLWTPVPGARAESSWESDAKGNWIPGQPMPESWMRAARDAAEDGLPLGKVLDALLARSLKY